MQSLSADDTCFDILLFNAMISKHFICKIAAVFLSKNIYILAWAWTALKFNNSQWSRFCWDVPLPCALLSIDGYEGRCPTNRSVCVCVLEGGGRKRETVKERAG